MDLFLRFHDFACFSRYKFSKKKKTQKFAKKFNLVKINPIKVAARKSIELSTELSFVDLSGLQFEKMIVFFH